MMKPNAIIVNEARGAVIDDKALVKALEEGKIWGAAIDTWEKEPLDPNDPLVKMEKVITTSHLGAATRETVVRCFGVGYDNIMRMRRGEELRNRIVLYGNKSAEEFPPRFHLEYLERQSVR